MSSDFIDGTIVAYFKAFYIENARQLLKCNGTEHQEGGTEKGKLVPVSHLWLIFIAFSFLWYASKSIEMQVLMKPFP